MQVDRKEDYNLIFGFAFPSHVVMTFVRLSTASDKEVVISVKSSALGTGQGGMMRCKSVQVFCVYAE